MKYNKKILCLGDNSSPNAWAHNLTKKFAEENNLTFRGMLINVNQKLEDGCYHVGPASMQQKDIINISKKFNKIVLLEQEQEQYSHYRIFLAMFKLINDLREQGIDVKEENTDIFSYLYYWEGVFTKNRSICALPFVEYHNHLVGGLNLCGRSMDNPIKEEKIFKNDLETWLKGEQINKIRQNIIKGQRIDNCKTCYRYEDKNIKDQRWNYSFNWIAKLKIKNIENLKKIIKPMHYNVRLNNKCNLMCRMCSENYSHLIEKENKTIEDKKFKTLIDTTDLKYKGSLDSIDLNNDPSVYITGGEPTINHELYIFLKKCIKLKKNNLIINIQTNAAKLNKKFLSLIKNFKNITVCCSIDGVKKINEYQRWNIDSDQQEKNIHTLYQQGHKIHITHVVSIYNVSTIGKTLKYFDDQFPFASVQLQWARYKQNILNPYNHPNKNMVLESIKEAKTTKCYWHNESGTTAIIDNLYTFYKDNNSKPNHNELQNFFYYNDTLDRVRGSCLADYIPDLEEYRQEFTINIV
jgi:organic radical activating enzyme